MQVQQQQQAAASTKIHVSGARTLLPSPKVYKKDYFENIPRHLPSNHSPAS
jgi:hypothetical protein